MNDILLKQIAIDYCCDPESVLDHQNHFTEHHFLEGRRRFLEEKECFLKVAAINGKLLFTGNESILKWCRENYKNRDSEWFFEAGNLCKLNNRLCQDGYHIRMAHPFFIAEEISKVNTKGYEIRWYHDNEIEQFRGDARFDEAFAFLTEAPDIIGAAAVLNGNILGMAGASCDSPTMWQIGINVDPETRNLGIGRILVSLLKNEILKKGILPYYGTSMSHIASQRVALGAGFIPAWAELTSSKIDNNGGERNISAGL